MRVVLDTNVWISGLLWGGLPGKILKKVYERSLTSITSEEILLELQTTLQSQKFENRLAQRQQTIGSLLTIVRAISQVVSIEPIQVPHLRDSQDTHILSTAIVANPSIVITGDRDLLVLEEFESILILTPKEFCDRYFPDIE